MRGWVSSVLSRGMRGPVGWGSVAALAVVGSGVAAYYSKVRERRLEQLRVKSLGRPAIGGPFTLVDHRGIPVTDVDFRGKYMLVYFGFTYCPDICPAELHKMAAVMNALQNARRDEWVVPVMISVDPRRDTIEKLASYVKEFHPRLIGLTGTAQQVQDVSKLYRVYSSTGLTEAELETMEDYLVDHSIFFYLMGPDGVIRSYFGKQMSAEQVTQGILQCMDEDLMLAGVGQSFWDKAVNMFK